MFWPWYVSHLVVEFVYYDVLAVICVSPGCRVCLSWCFCSDMCLICSWDLSIMMFFAVIYVSPVRRVCRSWCFSQWYVSHRIVEFVYHDVFRSDICLTCSSSLSIMMFFAVICVSPVRRVCLSWCFSQWYVSHRIVEFVYHDVFRSDICLTCSSSLSIMMFFAVIYVSPVRRVCRSWCFSQWYVSHRIVEFVYHGCLGSDICLTWSSSWSIRMFLALACVSHVRRVCLSGCFWHWHVSHMFVEFVYQDVFGTGMCLTCSSSLSIMGVLAVIYVSPDRQVCLLWCFGSDMCLTCSSSLSIMMFLAVMFEVDEASSALYFITVDSSTVSLSCRLFRKTSL